MRRDMLLVYVLASGWSWLCWMAALLLAGNSILSCDHTQEEEAVAAQSGDLESWLGR
jgi:hypothetical protein